MKNLITRATAHISSLLNSLQVKRFFAVVLVGFLLLTTNVDSGRHTRAVGEQLRQPANQLDSVRPKTTNEWYDEARQTEDAPGERLQNIAEESAKAVKEFGSLYPDTAKRSTNALKDDAAQRDKNS
ncbi:hypothetical protein [Allocoleopsis sp.]|uniref:hypothetical protein n=1 Tax=Allocoleopsis sp. TaxID=3088169 RepID=UPI002FD21992